MKPASIVFLLAIVAVVVIGLMITQKRKNRLTADAIGTVTSAEVKPINAKNSDFTTVVQYKYTVDGKDYVATRELNGRQADSFPVGKTGPIKYNPENPAEADVQ